MKTINKNRAGICRWQSILACALLAGAAITSQAQTYLNTFGSSSSPFRFDYGSPAATTTHSVTFAAGPTYDAAGSAGSGSVKLSANLNFTADGGGGAAFAADIVFPATNVVGYTLSFDIMVDAASTPGNFNDYGYFEVWGRNTDSYNFVADAIAGGLVGGAGLPSAAGVWKHVSVICPPSWTAIRALNFQIYNDAGRSINGQEIIYIDNLRIDPPPSTYANYAPDFFQFNDAGTVLGMNTTWYGGVVGVQFDSTLDSSNNVSSGSVRVSGTVSGGDNNDVMAWNFQTNQAINFYNPGYTNFINGSHFQSVELDVLWDSTNSTMSLAQFNAAGDISGFPVGLMEGADNGGGNNGFEALAGGATGITIPAAASNGWVHLSIPINLSTPGLADVTGLYFKKYVGDNTLTGLTYNYWVDNIVFKGGPLAIIQPTLTVSKPVLGLNFVNSAGDPYNRESLVTFDTVFTFVDQASPVTYNMNIAGFPSTAFANYDARIYLVPNPAATEAAPDYNEPTLLMIDISYNGAGRGQAVIRGKVNQANGNGTLYDASPTFTSTSTHVTGNWSFTFTQNTNILCIAPDGSSTNLPVPLGLTPAQVSSAFGSSMVVYFGGYNNGGANVGQRTVVASVGITNGATTLLADNFLTDTQIDYVLTGGTKWVQASGGGREYLTSPTTQYYVDWTVPADGFVLQTNNNLVNAAAWSTNGQVTTTQLGSLIHAEFDVTNLPPSGSEFFRLRHP